MVGTWCTALLSLAMVPHLTELTVWLTRPTPDLHTQYPDTCCRARMEGQQPAGPRGYAEDLYPCYGGLSGAKTKECSVLPLDFLTLSSYFLPTVVFPGQPIPL